MYAENFQKFILAIPAGMLMKVRTTGNMREMNTIQSPYLRNHTSARSTSSRVSSTYLPYLYSRGLPPIALTQ